MRDFVGRELDAGCVPAEVSTEGYNCKWHGVISCDLRCQQVPQCMVFLRQPEGCAVARLLQEFKASLN
jgi:hypothetical protein